MAYEHLIGTLKQESKTLILQEMKRRKMLLEKLKGASKSDFEDVYRQEREKLENNKKLM